MNLRTRPCRRTTISANARASPVQASAITRGSAACFRSAADSLLSTSGGLSLYVLRFDWRTHEARGNDQADTEARDEGRPGKGKLRVFLQPRLADSEQDQGPDRESRRARQHDRAEHLQYAPPVGILGRPPHVTRERRRRREQRLDLLLVELARLLDELEQRFLTQLLAPHVVDAARNQDRRERDPKRSGSQADDRNHVHRATSVR